MIVIGNVATYDPIRGKGFMAVLSPVSVGRVHFVFRMLLRKYGTKSTRLHPILLGRAIRARTLRIRRYDDEK